MAGNAVVGFEVWMVVIALDVESDGLQMLLAVTGAVIQLLAVTGSYWAVLVRWYLTTGIYYWQLYSYWQLLAVTGQFS